MLLARETEVGGAEGGLGEGEMKITAIARYINPVSHKRCKRKEGEKEANCDEKRRLFLLLLFQSHDNSFFIFLLPPAFMGDRCERPKTHAHIQGGEEN